MTEEQMKKLIESYVWLLHRKDDTIEHYKEIIQDYKDLCEAYKAQLKETLFK